MSGARVTPAGEVVATATYSDLPYQALPCVAADPAVLFSCGQRFQHLFLLANHVGGDLNCGSRRAGVMVSSGGRRGRPPGSRSSSSSMRWTARSVSWPCALIGRQVRLDNVTTGIVGVGDCELGRSCSHPGGDVREKPVESHRSAVHWLGCPVRGSGLRRFHHLGVARSGC